MITPRNQTGEEMPHIVCWFVRLSEVDLGFSDEKTKEIGQQKTAFT